MRFLFIGVPAVDLDLDEQVYDTLEETDFEYVITMFANGGPDGDYSFINIL